MNRTGLIAALALLVLAGVSGATIINVPDDQQTIQAGIDASEDGDTVLVQPREYLECINFQGKAITVGGIFLTTGDPAWIDSTIVDGNQNGRSVVAFSSAEGSDSRLIGLTITNGSTDYGGGIYCSDASPTLAHLVIAGNSAEQGGGGVYCTSGAAPLLSHIVIRDNQSSYHGGGFHAYTGAHPTLEFVTISGNQAEADGGGMHCAQQTEVVMRDFTVTGNQSGRWGGGVFLCGSSTLTGERGVIDSNFAADRGGGFYGWGSDLTLTYVLNSLNEASNLGSALFATGGSQLSLVNCTVSRNLASSANIGLGASALELRNAILWGYDGDQVEMDGNSSCDVSYSDVEGGRNGISGGFTHWGEGNLNEDPVFAAPDDADFQLQYGSPCIDAGDPDSPKDPDSSRADMGAYPFEQYGCIRGSVLSTLDDSLLPGALIATSFGQTTVTDSLGRFQIRHGLLGEFDITASLDGYRDFTLTGQQLELRDTLDLDFHLLRPLFNPAQSSLELFLPPDSTVEFDLSVSNSGNCPLEWTLQRRMQGNVADPWSLINSYSFGATVGDSRLEGVVFAGDRFYVTGGGGPVNYIYVFDRDGTLVDQFIQPDTSSHYGIMDLDWDGQLLWGVAGREVYGMDSEGTLIQHWQAGFNAEAIAWDAERSLLWIASITGAQIYGYSVEGIHRTDLDQQELRIFGLACWQDDPDGFPLYIFDSPNLSMQAVHKMNPATGDTLFVTQLQPDGGGAPRGAFITDGYVPFVTVFMGVSNAIADDRVDVWTLHSDPAWLAVEPTGGTIPPAESLDLMITLSAIDLDTAAYGAEIHFDFPEIRTEAVIPVTMIVSTNAAPDENEQQPAGFGITAAYPNPFNATVVVGYRLTVVGKASLRLYDITGRLAMTVAEGRQTAGEHRAVIDGSLLASGIYIARLAAGGKSSAVKMVCVK